jgi:hypothetical protein
VTREIGLVGGDERGEPPAGVLAPGVDVAAGRGQDERGALGADHMVRRRHAPLRQLEDIRPRGELHGLRALAKVQQPAARPRLARRLRQQASERRQDGAGFQRRRRGRRRASRDPSLGLGDELDHRLIGLARALAEGEDAVVDEDHAPRAGPGLEGGGRLFGELEPRHDIGHDRHVGAVDLLEDPQGVGLVGQGQDGRGVGMVDEGRGQEGVQKRLHRWRRRGAVQQVLALGVDHGLVAQSVELTQAPQRGEPHRGVAGRLDARQVPAAALDAQHLHGVAEQVLGRGFDRGVAAAVQYETRICPQEASAVGAQGQVLGDAFIGVAGHGRTGVGLAPETLQGSPASRARRAKLASQCSPM